MKCSRGDGRARFKFFAVLTRAILGQGHRLVQDVWVDESEQVRKGGLPAFGTSGGKSLFLTCYLMRGFEP